MALAGEPERQQRYLDLLRQRVAELAWVDVVVVIGSLADGRADAVSDVDLLVGVHEGAFAAAWRDRERLRVTGALYSWDHWHDGSKGVHKWLTTDAVLVEVLLGEPTSGIRLAPPWRVLAGDPGVAGRWPARPPITRAELRAGTDGLHPVEVAYDDFKTRLRCGSRPW